MAERVYSRPLSFTRQLYYPGGATYLRSVLQRFAAEPKVAASAWVLRNVDLGEGSLYVTVPFDCPEDEDFGSLEAGHFYYENEKSRQLGPRHLPEVDTSAPVNEAILQMVSSLDYTLVFERTAEPQFPWRPGDDRVAYDALYQRSFTSEDSSALLEAACLGSPDELRFLVTRDRDSARGCEPLSAGWSGTVALIACSVFDWSGYLLWYPRRRVRPPIR